MIVNAVLAADDQPGPIGKHDDAARREILVLVEIVAVDIAKRSEPVGGLQRARIARSPPQPNDALRELILGKLRVVGSVSRHDVDVAVIVHCRRGVSHPDAASAAAT